MIKTLLLFIALSATVTPALGASDASQACRQFTNYQDYMRCVQNQRTNEYLGTDDVDYACLIDPRKCY